MTETNDMALLGEYADSNSESAFSEIVRRHINLVYSVAIRFTGDNEDAKDVTHAVFVILARKAAGLSSKTILTGWLYETTRFTAMNFITGRARRQAREQEAYMQATLDSNTENVWRQLAPLLEEAMSRLSEKERTLVALRFFENRSVAETAAALGIQEWAARKRVERAMEKLRQFFVKRGIASTTAILAAAISANSVQAAPVALATSATAVALAKGGTASASTLTLIKGALKIMAWTKAKSAIVTGIAILLFAGTATVVVEKLHAHQTEQLNGKDWQVQQITRDNTTLENLPPLVKIVPTKFLQSGGWRMGKNNKIAGLNHPLSDIVLMAYGYAEPVGKPARMILETKLPEDKYDFIASLPSGSAKALQEEIKKQFGVVAKLEMRETQVLLLKVKNPNGTGLEPTKAGPKSGWSGDGGHWKDAPMSGIASWFEEALNVPVIDETRLTQRYNINLKLKLGNRSLSEEQKSLLKQTVLEQLGLGFVPATRSIEMLVVQKAEN